MRELSDMGMRVIVALLAGAGLVALLALADTALPPSGYPAALGGWPMLAGLAALLCGLCALGMSVGLRWPTQAAKRLTGAGLGASALAWGVCLSAAAARAEWERALAGSPWLPDALTPLATVGASVISWLLVVVALVGLVAGQRSAVTATARALTPLWRTPLWGAGVGAVYGLLFALIFREPFCAPGAHCYGLDVSRWDGLRVGLSLGIGAGMALGLTLTLALRLSLIVRPVGDERTWPARRQTTTV